MNCTVPLVLIAILGAASAQDSRPASRPTSRPAADDPDARLVRHPFKGEDLPGRDVTDGWAWRPIVGARYSAPDAMKHPVAEEDLVIGVAGAQGARAYPIKMLGGPQREIINDRLGSDPYAVNW